jgi:diguanylate cyclase (GGDEF)-like protein
VSTPPSPPAPTGRPRWPLLTGTALLGALTLAWIPAPTTWRALAGLAVCVLFVISETGDRRRWRSWHLSTVAAVVRAAQRDRLTGLDTRAVADDLLDTATREGTPVTVALIDLDGLHAINRQLGHAGGDQYLVALAHRLARAVPAGGVLIRQGGDEFTLITPAETSARALAATIGSVLSSPDAAGNPGPHASVGVATSDRGASGWHALACADAAMYTAKNGGGNRVLVYDPDRDGIPSSDGTRPPTRTRDRHPPPGSGSPRRQPAERPHRAELTTPPKPQPGTWIGPAAAATVPSTPRVFCLGRHIMTRDAVTVYDSYYLIDTRAWLNQRTGAHHAEKTTSLQTFTRCDVFGDYQPAMNIAARMQLWCAANDLVVGDGAVIEHDSQTLTQPIMIVLAATTGPRPDAFALVSVDGATAAVYADITTDEGYWHDNTTVEIACTGGLYWTSDGGAYLHTADGAEQRLTPVFGLGVPVIPRCRDCTAFDDGATEATCPCPRVTIYCPDCPDCRDRARVRLPELPSFADLLR